ncbi:MAG: DUF6817 domain-containing protein [Burkholderiaceae bacterium]
MSQSEHLFAELQTLGAGEFEHFNGSLAAHLHGTESLLREWGARETVCIAGLYHAVYGTDGFTPSLAGIDMRQRITTLLGDEAEKLAYLYGACNRRAYYPRIGSESQLQFADRFTNTEYDISNEQLRDLCELILANEMEIAQGSAEFRAKHGANLAKLFGRMKGLVSEMGFRTFQKVLG